MEEERRRLKRPFVDGSDSDSEPDKAPQQKRVRFPKGKKLKSGDYVVEEGEPVPSGWKNPRLAAKDRAMRRNQITAELLDEDNRGMFQDITKAEVRYEDNETFEDDGIQIEPFNLSKERKEGYFDADGNYVEYVNSREKDAWLDSIDAEQKFSGRISTAVNEEDEVQDLSSHEIGRMKRRIADVLEPEETVLQALRRLKGNSKNKKEKMTAENKVLFDQLTDDAMKLLENGDYDVYNEKKEVFQREAEGFEKLAKARGEGTSNSSGEHKSNGTAMAMPSSTQLDKGAGSLPSTSSCASNGDDAFDIFAEDDEGAAMNPVFTSTILVSDQDPDKIGQPSESEQTYNDYVYDESSGYYYNSSSGYYYDPTSGLYYSAVSGQWYSFNEESGTYNEVMPTAPAAS